MSKGTFLFILTQEIYITTLDQSRCFVLVKLPQYRVSLVFAKNVDLYFLVGLHDPRSD